MKELVKNLQFTRDGVGRFLAKLFLCYTNYDDEFLARNLKDILNDEDLRKHNSIISSKAKKSFLIGRFCAKKALSEFCNISNLSEIVISNGVIGQPIAIHKDIRNIQISISHTDDFAGAVAFEESHPIALDIEKIDNEKGQFLRSQFTSRELKLLKGLNISESVFHFILWTAKEGLSKMIKTGLMTPLIVFEIDTVERGYGICEEFILTYKNFKQYKASSYLMNGYVCSIIFPKNSKNFIPMAPFF